MDAKDAVTTLNVSLPVALKSYIERQVEQHAYTSASEFVRMLIRHHQQIEGRLDHLEELLIAGLESGPAIDAAPEYWAKKRATLSARHSGDRIPKT